MALDALGLGEHRMLLFPAPGSSPIDAAERLENSLQTSLMRQDQARGRGPEGKLADEVRLAVLQSAVEPRSRAELAFYADAQGRIVQVDLLNASADDAGWRRLAERLRRELERERLDEPSGARGLKVVMVVQSRPQLPSGADRGLAIDLFGVEVKRGDGPRSSRLKIGEFGFPGITLLGDPVDLAAPAAQVVHTRVVDVSLLR
jgi:hypothetical protein